MVTCDKVRVEEQVLLEGKQVVSAPRLGGAELENMFNIQI